MSVDMEGAAMVCEELARANALFEEVPQFGIVVSSSRMMSSPPVFVTSNGKP